MSGMHRAAPGGVPFHVLNRAGGRRNFFESTADDEGVVETVAETPRDGFLPCRRPFGPLCP
jgi:hypothetical protein